MASTRSRMPTKPKEVERPAEVKVRYMDLDGKTQEIAADGLLAVNMFGELRGFKTQLQRLQKAFDGRVLALPPCPSGNVVAFATAGEVVEVPAELLHERATALEEYARNVRTRPVPLDPDADGVDAHDVLLSALDEVASLAPPVPVRAGGDGRPNTGVDDEGTARAPPATPLPTASA